MASATNLNPGADATLVAAATNAAMANVPLDYSKAFGEIAKGYGKYTEGLGKIYQGLYNANSEAVNKIVGQVKEHVGDIIDSVFAKQEIDNQEVEYEPLTDRQNELIDIQTIYFDEEILTAFPLESYNSDEITSVQNNLLNAGYDIGPTGPDGKLGKNTKAAFAQAQKDWGEIENNPAYIQSEIERYERVVVEWEGKYAGRYARIEKAKADGVTDFTNYKDETYDVTTEKGYNAAVATVKEGEAVKLGGLKERLSKYEKKLTQIQPVKTGGVYTYKNGYNNDTKVLIGTADTYLLGLREELKEANKIENSQEKTKKITEITQLIKTAKDSDRKFGGVLIDAIQAIRSGDLLEQPLDGNMSLDFLRAAGERGRPIEDGSFVKFGFDQEGNKTILWLDKYGRPKINPATKKPFVAKAEDMSSFLVKKDASVETFLYSKLITEQTAAGKIKGATYNGKLVANDIVKGINTKEKFLNAINVIQADMDETYVESIWTGEASDLNDEMFVELNKLGGKFDNDGMNGVNADDFATQENYTALAKYLTEDSPGARRIFANVMAERGETAFKDSARRNYPDKNKEMAWKQLGFDDYGKYQEYLRNPNALPTVPYKNKKVEDMVNPQSNVKFSMWSDDIIKLQDRLSNIMENNKKNNIVPVRDQMYHWFNGWRKVAKRKDGKFYFIDDDGKDIKMNKARTYPTVQKVLDEQGILFQGNISSNSEFEL